MLRGAVAREKKLAVDGEAVGGGEDDLLRLDEIEFLDGDNRAAAHRRNAGMRRVGLEVDDAIAGDHRIPLDRLSARDGGAVAEDVAAVDVADVR